MKNATTSWPVDFLLTEKLTAFAKERGFDPTDEFEDFRDWAAATDAKYADWGAAFRTRIRNKQRWGKSASKPIGFTPMRESLKAGLDIRERLKQENEDYAREVLALTPEQRAANVQRLKAIAGSIK